MGNLLILTQLALDAATKVQQYNALMAKAHAEARDVTDAELDTAVGADDAERARLQALIDARKASPQG